MKYVVAVFLVIFASNALSLSVSGALGSPNVKVDTFCTHWHVVVHDSIPLTSATLIDDSAGNVYGQPGKAYKNVSFDSKSDPDNIKEITFSGKDTVAEFDVLVVNPFDSAYAPIIIYDKHGTHIIIELRYKSPNARISTLPVGPSPSVDEIIFPLSEINQQICTTVVYTNTAKAGGASFHINSVRLQKDIDFHINSITPGVPATLRPGDTLKVQVCYTAKDTLVRMDSIFAETDCSRAPLPVFGKGGTPLIDATDIDFGDVPLGTTICKAITISNRGTFPFVLTKNWILHNTNEFRLDPASSAILQLEIPPGGHVNLTVCYTPIELGQTDSTTIDWATDVDNQYTNQIKKWSYLRGRGVKPGVVFDRKEETFRIDSVQGIDSSIIRVYLRSTSNTETLVNQVSIEGPDFSEFRIAKSEVPMKILDTFHLSSGDSVWIDILFKPDLTKPNPIKYIDRTATLLAVYSDASTSSGFDTTVMDLTGTWAKSGVRSVTGDMIFRVHPNPVSGNSIELTLPSSLDEKVSILIFDILGREVYKNEIPKGNLNMEIPIGALPDGSYFVKVDSHSQKFEIIR